MPEIIINKHEQWWYNRGIRDAELDRAPIFNTYKNGIRATGEGFCNDDISEVDAGRAYLAGYNSK